MELLSHFDFQKKYIYYEHKSELRAVTKRSSELSRLSQDPGRPVITSAAHVRTLRLFFVILDILINIICRFLLRQLFPYKNLPKPNL